ncbi:MAG TPA: YlmH/Sll1252 family protein [Desulfitobacteriaceae bacterium]|nr:YlmH/Sll1252 family protein [Desulfitobacteriaceae bacterium]
MSQLAARIVDKCDLAIHSDTVQVTPFIPKVMKEWMENFLSRYHYSFLGEGGFPGAERVRLVIAASGAELRVEDAEVVLVWIRPDKQAADPEHRQVLGALIGLGLGREVIGDICQGQKGVYVAVTKEIAPFLINNWRKIGKTSIVVSYPEEELALEPDQGEELRITVASSRLDAVIAGGFGVSRTLVQDWIAQKKVKCNDLTILKNEATVRIGDMISCRGQGRLYCKEAMATRKGRTAWKVVVFRAKRHRRDDNKCK